MGLGAHAFDRATQNIKDSLNTLIAYLNGLGIDSETIKEIRELLSTAKTFIEYMNVLAEYIAKNGAVLAGCTTGVYVALRLVDIGLQYCNKREHNKLMREAYGELIKNQKKMYDEHVKTNLHLALITRQNAQRNLSSCLKQRESVPPPSANRLVEIDKMEREARTTIDNTDRLWPLINRSLSVQSLEQYLDAICEPRNRLIHWNDLPRHVSMDPARLEKLIDATISQADLNLPYDKTDWEIPSYQAYCRQLSNLDIVQQSLKDQYRNYFQGLARLIVNYPLNSRQYLMNVLFSLSEIFKHPCSHEDFKNSIKQAKLDDELAKFYIDIHQIYAKFAEDVPNGLVAAEFNEQQRRNIIYSLFMNCMLALCQEEIIPRLNLLSSAPREFANGVYDCFAGFYQIPRHPIQTSINLWNAATSPWQTTQTLMEMARHHPVRTFTSLAAGALLPSSTMMLGNKVVRVASATNVVPAAAAVVAADTSVNVAYNKRFRANRYGFYSPKKDMPNVKDDHDQKQDRKRRFPDDDGGIDAKRVAPGTTN